MKKDFVKRALCLVCCLTLTLGAFAYRPTKAEAVFISPAAALGASLLASVVVGTTATFFVSSGAADTIGTAIDGLVREFVSTTADLAGYTSDMFFEEIPNGLVVLQDGAIQLSAAAGNLTARFINWLQNDKGLTADGNDFVLSGTQNGVYLGGYYFPSLPISFSEYSYCFLEKIGSDFKFYCSTAAFVYQEDSFRGLKPCIYQEYVFDGSSWEKTSERDRSDETGAFMASGSTSWIVWAFPNIYDRFDGSLFYTGSEPVLSYEGDSVVSATPLPVFQSLPLSIPDGDALRINTGVPSLSLDDPQAAADNIMDAIYAGTLNPSIAVEQEATDTPGEDTEEDDVIAVPGADADLLDWTKYIGQKVAAVPQAIAKAVAGVFAPDAALVNEITGAFSAKFGFVETLKQVGDDLFGMNASSEPPVVWIHLEDAEGRYNYGGTVKALDMSWYQRYKADVDRIFGGFLWIAYLWLLFKRLPDIISGAGMAAADNMYVGEFEMVSGQKFTARRSKRL